VLMNELRGAREPSLAEYAAHFSPCDLVLVEGFKHEAIPQLEVYRPANGKPPLWPGFPHIVAVASDRTAGEPAGRWGVAGSERYGRLSAFITRLLFNLGERCMLSFDEALSRLLAARKRFRSRARCRRWLPPGACWRRRSGDRSTPRRSTTRRWTAMRSLLPMCRSWRARLPVSQRIPAGSVGTTLQPGTAARIFTGAPIPAGADAVVMQELCQHSAGGVDQSSAAKRASTSAAPVVTLPPAARFSPPGSACGPRTRRWRHRWGSPQLPVFRRLRVAVLFTGDELRMPGEALPAGAIYNANRFLLDRSARASRLRGA
jgi:hypothetical protein